jgi:predicted CoA-binding protein
MVDVPEAVAAFLGGRRIVVVGASRDEGQAANSVYRKRRDSAYNALPVNPPVSSSARCYPDRRPSVYEVVAMAAGLFRLKSSDARFPGR